MFVCSSCVHLIELAVLVRGSNLESTPTSGGAGAHPVVVVVLLLYRKQRVQHTDRTNSGKYRSAKKCEFASSGRYS